MTLALLILLAATATFGMMDLALVKGQGPLSYWLPQSAAATTAGGGEEDGDKEDSDRIRGPFKEVHEVLANITLAFVILHLGGVALASLAHRENLPRAMVTGRKRPQAGPIPGPAPSHRRPLKELF
jgi:cytochrome b